MNGRGFTTNSREALMRLIELIKEDITHLKASVIASPDAYNGVRDLFVGNFGFEDNAFKLLALFDETDLINKNLAVYIANELLDDDEYMYYSSRLGDDFLTSNWNKFIRSYCKAHDIDLSNESISQIKTDNSSIICETYTKGRKVEIDTFLSMHPYQRRMKSDILLSYYDKSVKRFLVHMPTGAGKTKTMMEALIDILDDVKDGGNIIWLAHSRELCEQAFETFTKLYRLKGSGRVNISRFFGKGKLVLQDSMPNVVFSSYGKLNSFKKSKPVDFIEYLGKPTAVIIVDEAHKVLAPTYSNIVTTILEQETQLIGLTATPGRGGDSFFADNKVLSEYFSSNMITIRDSKGVKVHNGFEYLVKRNYLSNVSQHVISGATGASLSQKDLQTLIETGELKGNLARTLGNSPERNFNTIKYCIDCLDSSSSHKILVFAPNTLSAKILQLALSFLDIKSGLVLGDSIESDRRSTIESFKEGEIDVLVNFGVLTTGFDSTNISHCIIARPTSSPVLYSQMVGRAVRGPNNGGNPNNIVVDVVDNYIGIDSTENIFVKWDQNYE